MVTERLIAIKRRVEMLTAGATPLVQTEFRNFLSWAEQNLGERQLQLVQFSDLTAAVAAITAAPFPRLFAIYAKKQNTATAAYLSVYDDPANAGTATSKRVQLPLLEALKEASQFYPDGLPLTTGMTLISATTANGNTPSTSGDGPNGFALIG